MKAYDQKKIQAKWQKKWAASKIYEPDLKHAKKPFYNLMMFPYPSAEGLHVGSVFTFAGIDAYGRFKRMQGYDVFEPIGLDAFGIHSENYALKTNTHPKELSERTEENFYRQLHEIGNSYDWTHTVETNKPDYYKWTQWLFLQMYKKGLAERKKASVNWCPSCLTVLADEQVIAGKCERCGTEAVMKELEQWFFKITEYAERLLANLEWIDWDESVKTMQKHWIGKKTGAEIDFALEEGKDCVTVFTTRADTIFGVVAVVIAPDYPNISKFIKDDQKNAVLAYCKQAEEKSRASKGEEALAKTGVFTGSYVINPLTSEKVPVWVGDYVLASFGTGAVMVVPAHDQRDYDFAKAYSLEIPEVVIAHNKDASEHVLDEAFEDEGVLVNSGAYTGLVSEKARELIVKALVDTNKGKPKTSYHIRDWLISRQRYWGPPIPIVYCDDCGVQPVPEADLPVLLPYIKDFRPTGTGASPLASDPEFVKTVCPNCGKAAKRETDVSDTFLDSSWYFMRYPSTDFADRAFDAETTKKWLPVDSYIGGKEHSVLHLLYSRFVTMVLYDMDLLTFEEPYKQFRPNGLIIKDGAKMSKSKGNVINPDEYIIKYGSDTLRCYLAFLGPFTEGGDFRDSGIAGMHRFLNRVWHLVLTPKQAKDASSEEEIFVNKTIKKVTEDIEALHFNTAISALMELANFITKQGSASKGTLETFVQLLAPFAPHVTEELWQELGQAYSVHTSDWPVFDERKTQDAEVMIVVQINGKARDKFMVKRDTAEQAVTDQATALEKIKGYLTSKEIRRIIYVPNKIVNIVV